MSQLTSLFSPIKVGHMELHSRLTMSCMAGGFSVDKDGYPDDHMIAYYAERAKSRPGLMGIGAGDVVPPFEPVKGMKYAPVLYNDDCIEPFKKMVDAIHQYDTKFGIQLWEGGMQSGSKAKLTPSGIGINVKAVGDSSVQSYLHVLSLDEIAGVIQNFADGAERCAKAGFDFVEIHAGHGYLISSFMTPQFNHRTDEYGGSFENRVRFLLDILRAVKARVGDRLTVGVKINGSDYLPENGWTVADAVKLAPMLEKEGADYIASTAGVMGSPRLTVPPLYEPQACFLEGAEEMKKVVSIPVSIVGRIKRPEMANQLIDEGKVDLVSMGRPFIADPEIVAKAREDRVEDIRPCLADCRGCLDHQMRTIAKGEKPATSCIVNARVGRELECVDIQDDKKHCAKTILVVGGGVAGQEAARRAAYSGHRVILCEQGDRLGGQLRMAEQVPGRQEIGDILPWFETQLSKLNVEVRLNTTVNEALIRDINPDELVIATGSLPKVPESLMTSIYNIAEINLLMADDVFSADAVIGDNVLVVGGEQIGMQIADYVSERASTVVVAEESRHFATKLAANDRWYLTGRLIRKKVQRIKQVRAIDIRPEDDVWLDIDGQSMQLPGIDTIILASERQSDRTLVEVAEKMGIKPHVIGDAADVHGEEGGTIFSNIAMGYDVARVL
jgi:2,4-dienoyl-CoA reductase-like NADH-dependent reductase (Old Yellow Enzyme family)